MEFVCFSPDWTWGAGCREGDHRGAAPFSSHPLRRLPSTSPVTDGVDLDHLAEVVSVRFLHSTITVFLALPTLSSVGGSRYAQPTPKECVWGVTFPSPRASIHQLQNLSRMAIGVILGSEEH